MNPSPLTVAENRTARLIREARMPRATSETPAREHLFVVQSESNGWFGPYPIAQADGMADFLAERNDFSDLDHAAKCWCQE
jgi:hypothetical protein